MEILNALFRTIFFYFVVVIAYRIMGKRELSQLQIIDFIITILMAELIAISIENINDPIYLALIPIVALVLIEILLAKISLKSKKFNDIMSGKPSLIILNGKLNFKELIKCRYSLDNLLLELRQNSIKSISDVEYAFLETNGKLSVFKYNILKTNSDYPMPIIVEGEIDNNTLKYIKKNKVWVLNELRKRKVKLEEVFYSFYKSKKLYIIKYAKNINNY